MATWRALMSNTVFPVSDLLHRRFQTGLAITTLTLSVASTLFLLLFSSRLGLGISSATGTLTMGLNAIFSQFLLFISILIFLVGAVLTSFIFFLMMAQRTRDIGLIKSAGCPNGLIAGYFTSELLIIAILGCTLGVLFGLIIDYSTANFVFSAFQSLPNFWFAPIVFAVFFVIALIFGTRPILKAAKMPPSQALSSVNYYNILAEKKHKPFSRRGLTWKIAIRSLSRRYSASLRIIVLLSIVFILLTVSVAGGVIAGDTTKSWIEKASGQDLIVIAHTNMADQYSRLLSTFSGAKDPGNFYYSDPQLAISDAVTDQVNSVTGVVMVDQRLVLKEHIQEIANFTIDHETLTTYSVGGNRDGEAIIIGVDPTKTLSYWSLQGRFFNSDDIFEAVIGDSIAGSMFSVDPGKQIFRSDPLVQGIKLQNSSFSIVGVAVDPLNNGLVTYVPIKKLLNATNISSPNLLLVKLDNSVNRAQAIGEIRSRIQTLDSDVILLELNDVVTENTNFLDATWSAVMLVPLLTLASAALCLAGYMLLGVEEQRQEFAVLRAIGARPRIVLAVVSIQSGIVLLSSFGVGLSLGVVSTLLILMKNPVVTSFTIIEISFYFLAALSVMFLCSIYPAFRLSRSPILKIIV